MPRTDLSATQVARLAGLPYQTLDQWLNTDVITCELPAEGTGTRRRFSCRDLAIVLLVRDLKRTGLRMDFSRQVAALLREHWTDGDPEHAGWIVAWVNGEVMGGRWSAEAPAIGEAVGGEGSRLGGVAVAIDAGYFARGARELSVAILESSGLDR